MASNLTALVFRSLMMCLRDQLDCVICQPFDLSCVSDQLPPPRFIVEVERCKLAGEFTYGLRLAASEAYAVGQQVWSV